MKPLPTLLLTLSMLALAPLATATEPPAAATTSASAASTPAADAAAESSRPCLKTGSRLRSRSGCVNAAGQVVTREEIQATGATTVEDVMRLTVPSATTR